ncbi:MAG: hypothetical protein ACFE8M_08015 [Candidatus Hermodarchaeota archaeon]
MVSKEQKKLERVINFMKKGLTSLSDDLGETVKGIEDFIKSLNKALKDLKEVKVEAEIQTVSTSSKIVATPTTGNAKTAAASTLFNLLSGGKAPAQAPSTASASPGLPKPPIVGAPKAPPSGGGPPKAPLGGGPPKRANLPPAPKLPPTSGGTVSPAAPSGGVVKAPTFTKRTGPPAAPSSGGPPRAPGAVPPGAPTASSIAPRAGGGLSSLRDEMLEELNRLKKIMRGE